MKPLGGVRLRILFGNFGFYYRRLIALCKLSIALGHIEKSVRPGRVAGESFMLFERYERFLKESARKKRDAFAEIIGQLIFQHQKIAARRRKHEDIFVVESYIQNRQIGPAGFVV